ncbi:DUF6884 domain-containing protein [Peterkaempfera griseoplana]|uniref:DUF6884 domain-containing protein n=1 Tax=Peterkaempfera griseoplana TaxID=66896 RepID=UPI0006E2AB8E|nr:DUF6884 domain-containing protein [Peterkaempfera griseoplana]
MTATDRSALQSPELVLITCGSRKLGHRARAADLYTGPYHRACRRAAQGLRPDHLLILSSFHGLVALDDVIEPYDTALDGVGSVTAERLRQQARQRGVLELDPVVVLAGARHTALARKVWPHALNPLQGTGGMGRQIAWLNALAGIGAPDDPAAR